MSTIPEISSIYGSLLFANTMQMLGSKDEKIKKAADFFNCAHKSTGEFLPV
jgi:hypothetical protein